MGLFDRFRKEPSPENKQIALVYVDAENARAQPDSIRESIETHFGADAKQMYSYSKWSAKSVESKKYRNAGFRLVQADSGDNNADIMMSLDAYESVRDFSERGVTGVVYISFHGDKGFTHLLEKIKSVPGWTSVWVTSNKAPAKMIVNSASEVLKIIPPVTASVLSQPKVKVQKIAKQAGEKKDSKQNKKSAKGKQSKPSAKQASNSTPQPSKKIPELSDSKNTGSKTTRHPSVPYLNTANKGLRLPREPEDFAQSVNWFISNYNGFSTYKECVESLKESGVVSKSRTSMVLKPILRAFSTDGEFKSITQQALDMHPDLMVQSMLEDIYSRTGQAEYIEEKELYRENVDRYFQKVSQFLSPTKPQKASPNVSRKAVQKSSLEWDFKPYILQLILAGATDSQKLGMAIIEFQRANNWSDTGKEAFNIRAGLKKSQSYISTIREYLNDSVEVEGTGPKFNFFIRNKDHQ